MEDSKVREIEGTTNKWKYRWFQEQAKFRSISTSSFVKKGAVKAGWYPLFSLR